MTDEQTSPTPSNRAEMLTLLNERVVSGQAQTGARVDLASATRSVIDELMRSTASDEDFERAAEMVAGAVALLRGQSHGRGYLGVAYLTEREAHCFVERTELELRVGVDIVLVDDHVVTQRLDQRLRDGLGYRGHHVDPLAREPR